MNGGQIGNVDLVKQLNSAAVYRLIDQQGPISRIQVADVSQLAPASVTKITRQLLERGLIKEVAQQASTGGRRAISLTTEVKPFIQSPFVWDVTTFSSACTTWAVPHLPKISMSCTTPIRKT